MIFTIDLVINILHNFFNCTSKDITQSIDFKLFNEDLMLSMLFEIYKPLKLNIGRLDFVEYKKEEFLEAKPKTILFNKCVSNDTIFCYRFKTFNRQNDINVMSILLDNLYIKDFQILKFIDYLSKAHRYKITETESLDFGKRTSSRLFYDIREVIQL